MAETLAYLIGILVALVICAVIYSFIHAALLRWRARKLQSWIIAYRPALALAFKVNALAYLAGVPVGLLVMALAPVEKGGGDLGQNIGLLVAIVVWASAHRRMVGALATKMSVPLDRGQARAITVSVFGFSLIIPLVLGVIGVALSIALRT